MQCSIAGTSEALLVTEYVSVRAHLGVWKAGKETLFTRTSYCLRWQEQKLPQVTRCKTIVPAYKQRHESILLQYCISSDMN
jgi:hypothetical protein